MRVDCRNTMPSFNEAPPAKGGEYGDIEMCAVSRFGFNEAPPAKGGEFRVDCHGCDNRRIASMRPPQQRGGNVNPAITVNVTEGLQ